MKVDKNKIKNWKAISLLKLVKEHRKICDGKCGISTFALFEFYKLVADKKTAEKSLKYFL